MPPSRPVDQRRSIAVVTCYRYPDYVRAVSLRAALRAGTIFDDVIVVKNRSHGIRRYLEVVAQLWELRRHRPDAYLVTFRGYEILPIALALAGRRPVVFDEFINPVEWFVHEHRKFAEGSVPARVLRAAFRTWSRRARMVLADTESHAELSARLMGIERSHYRAIPVGTDEQTFAPQPRERDHGSFTVLYYGSMLPLHGLDHVLEAAVALRDHVAVRFEFVGGDEETATLISAARARGARADHRRWVDYDRLPELFGECDLFLAGPFGGTLQSQYVITGKAYQFLCAGLPTVVGANHESAVFTDKVDALIVPQASPAALAEAVAWAADHPTELAAIGLAGRRLYESRFSVKEIASLLDEIPWDAADGAVA